MENTGRDTIVKALNAGLSQSQREAVLDLLLSVIFVDASLHLDETNTLYGLEGDVPWESPIPIGQYVRSVLPRVRDAASGTAARDLLLSSVDERLRDSRTRRLALDAASAMAGIDGTVDGREAQWIESVRAQFDKST